MAFHEPFWAVVAGVAPVVALASLVSLTDSSRTLLTLANRLIESDLQTDDWTVHRLLLRARHRTLIRLRLTVWINIGLQAALLAIGLLSIAYQVNYVPPWWAVAGAVTGILILGIPVIWMPYVLGYDDDELMGQWLEHKHAEWDAARATKSAARAAKRSAKTGRTDPFPEDSELG